MNWKALAIVLIAIQIIQICFVVWSVQSINHEEEQMNECYYNVCKDYPQADIQEGVCSCYYFDEVSGEYELSETAYIG